MKCSNTIPVVVSLVVIAALVATHFNSSSYVSNKYMNDSILQTCSSSRWQELNRNLADTVRKNP
jgi:hypothetical protein